MLLKVFPSSSYLPLPQQASDSDQQGRTCLPPHQLLPSSSFSWDRESISAPQCPRTSCKIYQASGTSSTLPSPTGRALGSRLVRGGWLLDSHPLEKEQLSLAVDLSSLSLAGCLLPETATRAWARFGPSVPVSGTPVPAQLGGLSISPRLQGLRVSPGSSPAPRAAAPTSLRSPAAGGQRPH